MDKVVGGPLKYSLAAKIRCPATPAQGVDSWRSRRMDSILTGQLGQRLLFAQGRPGDLRLDLCAVMRSHTVSLRFHVSSPASLSKILGPGSTIIIAV
jgi:hypothetical protein